MAIVQYRTNSTGGYRYTTPSATEVSQMIPAVGDWYAIQTAQNKWVLLCGELKEGKFTGKGISVSSDGIQELDAYTDEDVTIYNNYYVYSNADNYRTVDNIRARDVTGYFCGFLWAGIILYLLIGGAFKCVKSLVLRSAS